MKKLQNISTKLASCSLIVGLLLLWQLACTVGKVPDYLLPSPLAVGKAFWGELPLLLTHARTTLTEAFFGLSLAILLAFICSLIMEHNLFLHKAIYPLLVLSQTVPTIAIAPLLVLWLGYDMAPKIALIVITCFFPMTISLLTGYAGADPDAIHLLQAMGASKRQILRFIKLPSALPSFFSGLRVSVSYSIVGAVIAEWLGGVSGLGVYMIRVKKSYAFDKMFAVIFLISLLSLLLIWGVGQLQKAAMPWQQAEREKTT